MTEAQQYPNHNAEHAIHPEVFVPKRGNLIAIETVISYGGPTGEIRSIDYGWIDDIKDGDFKVSYIGHIRTDKSGRTAADFGIISKQDHDTVKHYHDTSNPTWFPTKLENRTSGIRISYREINNGDYDAIVRESIKRFQTPDAAFFHWADSIRSMKLNNDSPTQTQLNLLDEHVVDALAQESNITIKLVRDLYRKNSIDRNSSLELLRSTINQNNGAQLLSRDIERQLPYWAVRKISGSSDSKDDAIVTIISEIKRQSTDPETQQLALHALAERNVPTALYNWSNEHTEEKELLSQLASDEVWTALKHIIDQGDTVDRHLFRDVILALPDVLIKEKGWNQSSITSYKHNFFAAHAQINDNIMQSLILLKKAHDVQLQFQSEYPSIWKNYSKNIELCIEGSINSQFHYPVSDKHSTLDKSENHLVRVNAIIELGKTIQALSRGELFIESPTDIPIAQVESWCEMVEASLGTLDSEQTRARFDLRDALENAFVQFANPFADRLIPIIEDFDQRQHLPDDQVQAYARVLNLAARVNLNISERRSQSDDEKITAIRYTYLSELCTLRSISEGDPNEIADSTRSNLDSLLKSKLFSLDSVGSYAQLASDIQVQLQQTERKFTGDQYVHGLRQRYEWYRFMSQITQKGLKNWPNSQELIELQHESITNVGQLGSLIAYEFEKNGDTTQAIATLRDSLSYTILLVDTPHLLESSEHHEMLVDLIRHIHNRAATNAYPEERKLLWNEVIENDLGFSLKYTSNVPQDFAERTRRYLRYHEDQLLNGVYQSEPLQADLTALTILMVEDSISGEPDFAANLLIQTRRAIHEDVQGRRREDIVYDVNGIYLADMFLDRWEAQKSRYYTDAIGDPFPKFREVQRRLLFTRALDPVIKQIEHAVVPEVTQGSASVSVRLSRTGVFEHQHSYIKREGASIPAPIVIRDTATIPVQFNEAIQVMLPDTNAPTPASISQIASLYGVPIDPDAHAIHVHAEFMIPVSESPYIGSNQIKFWLDAAVSGGPAIIVAIKEHTFFARHFIIPSPDGGSIPICDDGVEGTSTLWEAQLVEKMTPEERKKHGDDPGQWQVIVFPVKIAGQPQATQTKPSDAIPLPTYHLYTQDESMEDLLNMTIPINATPADLSFEMPLPEHNWGVHIPNLTPPSYRSSTREFAESRFITNLQRSSVQAAAKSTTTKGSKYQTIHPTLLADNSRPITIATLHMVGVTTGNQADVVAHFNE